MRPPFHGWYIVLCCFGIAMFGWGLGFYGASVYLVRLRDSHGWSAGTVSVALTFYNLVMAALVIYVSDAVARWGSRYVVMTGSLVLGLGAAVLPLVTALWALYAVLFVMALGFAAIGGAAINAILAEWFDAKRGLALSLALNGASCAGIVITPAMIWLTEALGFARGLWLLIAVMWGLLWPPALLLLRRPGDLGLFPDGAAEPPRATGVAPAAPVRRLAVLGNLSFQSVTIAFGLGLTAQVGFLMHQVAYLSGSLGIEGAGWCVAATTTCAVVGRMATGLVIDRFDPRRVASVNFLFQSGALALLLWQPSTAMIYVASALFGLSVGNMITLSGLIVHREFPSAQFGRVVSLVFGIDQVVLAFGPGLIGVVHDWSGGYAAALIVCLVIDLVAAAVVLARRNDGHAA